MLAAARRLGIPGLGALDSQTVKADLLAGITVSLVAVPQSLAYAQLAGVPPIYGLYAALIPTIVGALAGSSAILSTGPVAMTSLLTAASIAPLAGAGTQQFYAYAVLLALISGLFQLGFGLLRMGVLLNFLSHPVLMGFINAAAIIIGLSQLPTLLGISGKQTEHFLLDIGNILLRINELDLLTLGFGITSIAALLLFRKHLPKWPGVLITVVALTTASYLIGFEKLGGRVVGVIPQGLPSFGVPPLDWHASVALLPAGFVIALISFMEAMSSAKVIAIRTRTRWEEDRELIGQGLAKIAASFCNSMPVSGSFSRSALNLASGARTKLSSLVSAVAVAATLLFLTPLLHHLPKAVLAAIIMVAVANLVNIRIIRNAWRSNLDDGVAGSVTFLATLAFAPNIQNGILTGILLSLALMLYRLMRPRVAVLGLKDHATLLDGKRHDIEPLSGKLAALRFDGALLFINVAYFEDALIDLERRNPSVSHILVKCSGINQIDASGIEMLFNVVERFKSNGVTLAFSGLKEEPFEIMKRSGLIRAIGAENIHATDEEALAALRPLWDPVAEKADAGAAKPPPPLVTAERRLAERRALALRGLYRGGGAIKILVPVDGSALSQKALAAAVTMAKAGAPGSLVLLNAQSAGEIDAAAGDVFMTQTLENRELELYADAALKPAVEVCEKSGVIFKTRKERGAEAQAIARVAAEEDVDQIVMGTRGHGLLAGLLLRSVSTQVVELAKVPVLLVK